MDGGINITFEESIKDVYQKFIDSLKNSPLILLTSLSLVIAGASEFFNLQSIPEFAIGASLCFFIALIFSILNNFKEHIYIKSFVILMMSLGFFFFICIIGTFIQWTWTGNFVYNITMIIIFIMMFIFLNNESFYLYNLLKKIENEISNKKKYLIKIALIIHFFLIIIGTSLFIVGMGGQVVIKLISGSAVPYEYDLAKYIFLLNVSLYGLMFFVCSIVLWIIPIFGLKKFRRRPIRKKIWDWKGDYV